jgi:hypothetical protein
MRSSASYSRALRQEAIRGFGSGVNRRLSGGEDTLYAPRRVFDEDILVLPSGRSLIARLLTMANRLVIEDADLLPCHLEHHFRQFALGDLFVTDLTDEARRRGAAVYLIERKQHGDSTNSVVD